jgi:hypothetical protein
MGSVGTLLTSFPSYSCYDDFTFDKKDTMSGASDDFAYDHLGIFSWTTEFWDIVHRATGHRMPTKMWYTGPSVEDSLAIAKWADQHCPELYPSFRPFLHPQLGMVELGGINEFKLMYNPPTHMLKHEVAGHAEFAIYQVKNI